MVIAVRRTFAVSVPRALAWQKLAEVRTWPEWAPHIAAAALSPGPLGATSTGWLKLRGLGRSSFRMTGWDPPNEWTWQGRVARTRVVYEHRFVDSPQGAQLEWVVSLEGPLARLIKPLFARVYGRNLDRAIPRLQAWIAS
jgi:hypothetical protein